MPTGAELFVDAAQRLGMSEIFTLVGDHLNEVLRVAARRGVRIIDFRHESGVTHAADAWARLKRKPALALVTGGPGHTNALTGIAAAKLIASPLIVVSGSRPRAMAERQAFQDLDQLNMVKPIVKWAAEPPSAAQIPFYLSRARAEALSGRMGPVYLNIPADTFLEVVEAPLRLPLPQPRQACWPDSRLVETALMMLKSSLQPVVIAGSGVWWADARAELHAFVEKTRLPIYTIGMARGVISDEHPQCFGYADPALNKAVRNVFREADLFLVLGKRIDYRLAFGGPRLFSPEAKFIQVDIHPPELGMNRDLDLGICADVKSTLAAMLEEMGDETWPELPWLEQLRQFRQQWESELLHIAEDSTLPIHPAAFYAEFKKLVPSEALFSWDGADFGHWGRAIIPARKPGGWLRLGPLGAIGSALPNSIALQLANPGKPVVLFTGDGSFGFYLSELDTMVRHSLPVVIIIGNDAAWGLERELQKAFHPSECPVACELRPTRYDVIMKGFGGEGENIHRREEIGPALQRAFSSRVPYLLNVHIRGARSPFTDWQISGKKKNRSVRGA